MKERPIPFKAPMVRAILDGTKTQTRRAVKLRDLLQIRRGDATHYRGVRPDDTMRRAVSDVGADGVVKLCPYGQPGDRLWVREAWRTVAGADDIPPRDLMNVESFTRYEADAAKPAGMGKLRPGMFMPRWASRILLEVVSVRVERLQDISEADARAEGVCELPGQAAEPGCWWTADVGAGAAMHGRTPSGAYRLLWESINGPDSWDANPWVWVVEFKRVAGPKGE